MDERERRRLRDALERFGGGAGERRAVARQAGDLADSGRYRADFDADLEPELVVSELADAPRGSPAERWNWWLGSLEVSHGGYREFQVRRYPRDH